MTRRIDMTGQVFGYLTVIGPVPYQPNCHSASWTVKCVCGKTKIVGRQGLIMKTTTSCGCLTSEIIRKSRIRHGATANGSRTNEYRAYSRAKRRCNSPKSAGWKYYGKKGIKFLFKNFEEFFTELGPLPPGKTLDRYPNNQGNYEPGNVRWATPKEQVANQVRGKRNLILPSLSGRFGKLVVLKRYESNDSAKTRRSMWLCLCDCGERAIVSRNSLTSGDTKSCGCTRGRPGESFKTRSHKHPNMTQPFSS